MCGRGGAGLHGWKIYVSCTILNMKTILEATVPTLLRSDVQFKYVKDINTLRGLNAGGFGYSQIGKCLVVYMPQPDDALINSLMASLEPFRNQCPVVPYAIPFGGGLPLYYRYGAFVDEWIEINGESRADDRWNRSNAVPEGVKDELRRFVAKDDPDTTVGSFLLTYPGIEALVQQGKTGIFRSLNLNSEEYQEVVLKFGYPNGQVQPDGSDGCTFLRRELAFYQELLWRGLAHVAPKLVDSYDDGNHAVIVMESIDGPSILSLRMDGQLSVDHLEKCWDIIQSLHQNELYLGDAKIANFLLDQEGNVKVIDFETSGVIGQTDAVPIRTFNLHNPLVKDQKFSDLISFLVSVLFPYESGNYGSNERKIDLQEYRLLPPVNDAMGWAQERLSELLVVLEVEAEDTLGGPG